MRFTAIRETQINLIIIPSLVFNHPICSLRTTPPFRSSIPLNPSKCPRPNLLYNLVHALHPWSASSEIRSSTSASVKLSRRSRYSAIILSVLTCERCAGFIGFLYSFVQHALDRFFHRPLNLTDLSIAPHSKSVYNSIVQVPHSHIGVVTLYTYTFRYFSLGTPTYWISGEEYKRIIITENRPERAGHYTEFDSGGLKGFFFCTHDSKNFAQHELYTI